MKSIINIENKDKDTMEFQHGGDIYRNVIEYDFSTNINPLGMPKGCEEAIRKAIPHIGEYPDPQGETLCQAIAHAEGLKTRQVLLGNGAAELIYGLCYGVRPKKAVLIAPCFSEYEKAVTAAGGICEFVALDEKDGFRLTKNRDRFTKEENQLAEGMDNLFVPAGLAIEDADEWTEAGHALLSAIKEDTDLVFLCNPNNPTGATIGKELLYRVAEKCEAVDAILCVDECFLPFMEAERTYTMKGELERFPHLLVLRAFTKIYGMPGLRLGYALSANQELLDRIKTCLPPWNTSVIAQAVGTEALKDTVFMEQTGKLIRREKEYLIRELQSGLAEEIYASEANFLFFRSRPDLKERLLEQKILIRDCSNYRNLSQGYFRIAVRGRKENEELIRRWRS